MCVCACVCITYKYSSPLYFDYFSHFFVIHVIYNIFEKYSQYKREKYLYVNTYTHMHVGVCTFPIFCYFLVPHVALRCIISIFFVCLHVS